MQKPAVFLCMLSLFVGLLASAEPHFDGNRNKTTGKNIDVENFNKHVSLLYNQCNLHQYGLDKDLFKKTLIGYYNLKAKEPNLKPLLTIIDFDKPSIEKRLWIIDLEHSRVLFHTLVAHGRNSGENETVHFSNLMNSNMSSLGFYITRNTYFGKHGLSLIIDGLDKNVNCNARSRAIVIHGADYVSKEFIECNGRLGRSHGCPAIPSELNEEIINVIEGGSILFINRSGQKYKSSLLTQQAAVNYLKSKT